MSKFQRIKGKIEAPYFVLVYGVNGVGKTSFAAQAPGVVFVDIEGGTKNVDVERYPQPKTYAEFIEQLNDVSQDPAVKTVAIDTLDHLELLLQREVCAENKVDSISDIPYGGGYEKAKDKWVKLIAGFEELAKTKNVILLGHTEVKQFNDPHHTTPYDRYQVKLDKRAVALIKDRVQAILFAAYDTFLKVDKNTQKAKAFGGSDRVLFTEYRAHHDGKNRFGLPYQVKLDWKEFDEAAKAGNPESIGTLTSVIEGLLTKLADEERRAKATEAFEAAKAENSVTKLVSIKNRLLAATQE
jgi:hypothetical protein